MHIPGFLLLLKFLLFRLKMSDTRQIEIEFVYTRELFREAYLNLFNSKVKPQNFIWFGAIIIVIFLFSYGGNSFFPAGAWYYLPLLGIPLGYLFTKLYLPRKWGDRTFKKYEGRRAKWIITSENIQIITDKSKSTVRWSFFEKATISNGVILLVTSKHAPTPVPVSAFSNEDFELFKTWLDKNVPGAH
jgi:hypothetical protein